MMFPKHIKWTPIVISLIASAGIAVAFYFIDMGIEASRANAASDIYPAGIYAEYLSLAKWLIIAGFIVKGILSGITSKQ
ncbi:MAG: hypothetical protein HWE27_06860 [Gammaproteobacteria bacterium]|nr:hypothetical protein [Gammaproteobacteria bacterium]